MSAVIEHADQCWVAMRWNGGHCVCGAHKRCEATDPYSHIELRCARDVGHEPPHRDAFGDDFGVDDQEPDGPVQAVPVSLEPGGIESSSVDHTNGRSER